MPSNSNIEVRTAECDQMPSLDIPVVFIIFNRPEVTQKVFSEISKQRPKYLFIVSDGARPHRTGETERVLETRSITECIDWPCKVHRNYADTNMGCKKRVASGIEWAFKHVDKAIILEDDCLPSQAFFSFCQDMLTKYEHEKRVFAVSGTYLGLESQKPGHYFSRYALMWGWATWKDRWEHYQIQPSDQLPVLVRTWWQKPVTLLYWLQIIKSVRTGKLDTWDIQWILTVWRNKALACRPNRNLVQNLGFGVGATHTDNALSDLGKLPLSNDIQGLDQPLTPLLANAFLDEIDERRWAMVNIRSVLLMTFPVLTKIRAYIS